jgi:hypothetical protein
MCRFIIIVNMALSQCFGGFVDDYPDLIGFLAGAKLCFIVMAICPEP